MDSLEAFAAASTKATREFSIRRMPDGVLLIGAGDYYALTQPPAQERLRRLPTAVREAGSVVVDLRSTRPADAYGRALLLGAFEGVERLLTTDTLWPAGERRRVYYGYESPTPFSSGQYRTGWFIRSRPPILPAKWGPQRPGGLPGRWQRGAAAGRGAVAGPRNGPDRLQMGTPAGVVPRTSPMCLWGRA